MIDLFWIRRILKIHQNKDTKIKKYVYFIQKTENATVFSSIICDFLLSAYNPWRILLFIFMRKILIVSSLALILSSCGFKSDTDFTSLYKSHVHSQIESIRETAKSLWIYRQEQSKGAISALVNVPMMISGSLAFDHDAKVNGRDADISLKNLRASYESLMGSGNLSLEQFGMISKSSDTFFFFQGLNDTLLPEDIRAVLAKYEKTWLSWTKEDMRKTLSGASSDEILANTIVENLSQMTLDDLEKHLTKHPIFTHTADLGMVENLHVFAIDLNRSAVLNLATNLTQDLTGSGISESQKQNIQKWLEGLSFSGTLAFDPKDAQVAEMHLTVSESGSAEVGTIDVVTNKTQTQIRMSSAATRSGISFTVGKEGNKNTLSLSISENGADMGKLTGYIQKDGKKFQELALDVTAQGMTVSLKHTLKQDGNFEWSMNLPVIGAITWNGALSGKKLTALSMTWNTPSGSVLMELKPQGDRVVGPLILKQGSDTLFSSIISLLLDEGKFGLGVDILPSEATGSTEPQARVSIDMTNTTTPFYDSISVPSWVKPLQSLLDELDALMPSGDAFVPEAEVTTETVTDPETSIQ